MTSLLPGIQEQTEAINDEELKTLFEEDFAVPCECSHVPGKQWAELCGLNLHADPTWGARNKGTPCSRSATGVYVFRGECDCGEDVVERAFYLCDECAEVWKSAFLVISYEKL